MEKYSGISILRKLCLITITMLLLISTTAINNVDVEARDFELDMVTCYLTTRNPECFKKFLNRVKSATEVCRLLHSSSAVCAPAVPPPHHPTPALVAPSPPKTPVVALQWSMGLCKTTKCKNRPQTNFTLHGVWPPTARTRSTEQWKDCWPKLKKNKSLIKDLKRKWPSFFERNEDFWKHEWEKHGKDSGLSCFDYFQLSVRLADKIDVLAALKPENIIPSPEENTKPNTPTVKQYFDAISKQLNLIPRIKCGTPSTKYLVEIQFRATSYLKSPMNYSESESADNYDENCGHFKDRTKTLALFYTSIRENIQLNGIIKGGAV